MFLSMSQWTAEWFLDPVSAKPFPSAMWMVPPIFSSKRMFLVNLVMLLFVPMAVSPKRSALLILRISLSKS